MNNLFIYIHTLHTHLSEYAYLMTVGHILPLGPHEQHPDGPGSFLIYGI